MASKEEEILKTTQETKAAIYNRGVSDTDPNKFIKFKPTSHHSSDKIIQMVEIALDPLNPPKFKYRKLPRSASSPPVPVISSPPRPATAKDEQDWNIPPCVSNWKNQKGYTIPLDKRTTLDHHRVEIINLNFHQLSEALYVAEERAREAVAMRLKVQREVTMKDKERKERELRELARKARSERAVVVVEEDVDVGRLQRERVREERHKERSRLMGKRSRSRIDRDITEKVALGMANTNSTVGGVEVLYDQRLFNQEKGMGSGFANDDAYNIYDKTLFTTIDTLYRPKKKEVDDEVYGGVDLLQVKKRKAFVHAHGEEDIFGLDKFLSDINVIQRYLN